MTPTMAQIEQWARDIVLPTCVGIAFVNTYGRLPQNIPELENWGNSTGRRNPQNLVWTCLGGDSTLRPGAAAPPGAARPPGAVGAGAGGLNQIAAQLGVSPEVLTIGAVGLLILLMGRKR